MSSDGSPNGPPQRRGSITQASFTNLFQRGPTTCAGGSNGQMNGGPFDTHRRRLSVTTMGLSGTSPTSPSSFNLRRGSMSTNSDSIDESVVEDDEMPGTVKTIPAAPFGRRTSFGGSNLRTYRPGGNSPGNGKMQEFHHRTPDPELLAESSLGHARCSRADGGQGRGSIGGSGTDYLSIMMASRTFSDSVIRADQPGLNWSEQLRSRAESCVSAVRPSFSLGSSPPRPAPQHDRTKSVSDMMQPPVQAPRPAVQQPKPEPRKPDAFQERILKGDFYMD
ncbi:hypothetical protein E4U17_008026 [Claviceps sp. LM77 group G4]|nr:hypothetical protein E4U17_008026 [Claviceps sp. LM77 group G4]KAG6061631.1 hypothetical protein E4U33_006655 [Claviceps sp. LM78 group G4]KAG6065643.1 hypothetical protein E4U16_000387 [Claviceps sp. LM84 group G4]